MVKVLLADDDFTMVSLLKTLLRMEGYEVATLMDQKGDVMDIIRREKPDILMIDVFLGEHDGREIVGAIRLQPDLKDIKIVMVSGIDMMEECLAAGANDFLLKPYMPEQLLEKQRS